MVRMARKGRMALSASARKGRVTLDKIVAYRPPNPWLSKARQFENELLDTPVEAWHLMGGDVVRRERGPWPQRILIVLAILIFIAGFALANIVAVHASVSHLPGASPVVSAPRYVDPVPKPTYLPGEYSYAGTPNPYGSVYPSYAVTLDQAAAFVQRIWLNKGWGSLSLVDAQAIVVGAKSPLPPPFLGWPVAGGAGHYSRYFSASHPAVDIYAPCGTHLIASRGGTISWAGWKTNGGGYVVDINAGSGWLLSYNHLSAIVVVRSQVVVRGQYIGRMGMTGWATGCHVHFMVAHNGVWVNPVPLFR